MKKLPIGDSSFKELLASGAMYIDKTGEIYKLLQPRTRYFFSRPRRFGKSLTCSTLDAIFSGDKELFKDLWIGRESNYKFEKHQVIRFDFSRISHQTPEILEKSLHSALNATAKKHEIPLSEEQLSEKFAELITLLAEKHGPVVVIIDEYDKPITDLIDKPELCEQAREILRNFYGTLKGDTVDAVLHFLFITGVSKFSKVALFSELNNLRDLTMATDATALVGYTDQEVDFYLEEHIQEFAQTNNTNFKDARKTLKNWYNGYQFSPDPAIKVYNPFSLHNCLTDRQLKNYWFTSGTPNFLMKFIQKNPLITSEIEDIDGSFFSASNLDSFTTDFYYQNYKTLLLQTGYLTFVSDYDYKAQGYIVGYPNEEVRYSMIQQIMQFVVGLTPEQFGEFGKRFINALAADDLGLFCKHMQDFIKIIPHDIRVTHEKFYQQIFFMICVLFGKCNPTYVETEVSTENGFMDLYLDGTKYFFVVEFKRNHTCQEALEQIERKRYWERYEILKTKPVILAGINFDETEKNGKQGVVVTYVTKAL